MIYAMLESKRWRNSGNVPVGLVPMTAFGKMLSDEEVAAVLTYVRNSFGNKAGIIDADQVKKVREATKDQDGFYQPADLLKLHPHK